MEQIPEQAVSYGPCAGDTDAVTISKLAKTVLSQTVVAAKSSPRSKTRNGETLTFVLNITNSGNTALHNVTIQ